MIRRGVQMAHAVLLLCLPLAAVGGEVILYNEFNDTQSDVVVAFSASQTIGCHKAAVEFSGDPYYYGVSTSRVLAPTCTFYLYSDTACKTLRQKVQSNDSRGGIRNIKGGLKSYKVSCNPSSALPPASGKKRRRDEVDDDEVAVASAASSGDILKRDGAFYYLEDSYFFQPPVTISGNTAGGKTINAYNAGGQNSRTLKPAGSTAHAAADITRAIFTKTTKNTRSQNVTVTTQGTKYRFLINAADGYTPKSAVFVVGPAAYTSIVADTLVYLKMKPTNRLDISFFVNHNQLMDLQIYYA